MQTTSNFIIDPVAGLEHTILSDFLARYAMFYRGDTDQGIACHVIS